MRGQGSGPTASLRAGGERRVCEAREIIDSGAGRNRFERGSIESPYKRQVPFSGNPFLPVRDKAIDSGRFRALRARVGEVQKFRSRRLFGGRIFWRGMRMQIHSVLAPPSRARTSPFAGGSETSEAPYYRI